MKHNFDWTQQAKEPFYQMTEQRIKEAGFEGIAIIDRQSFGITGDGHAKVFIQPIHVRGNLRVWASIKRLEGFMERKPPKNKFGQAEKPIFYHGHFIIPMAAGEEEQP